MILAVAQLGFPVPAQGRPGDSGWCNKSEYLVKRERKGGRPCFAHDIFGSVRILQTLPTEASPDLNLRAMLRLTVFNISLKSLAFALVSGARVIELLAQHLSGVVVIQQLLQRGCLLQINNDIEGLQGLPQPGRSETQYGQYSIVFA